MNATRLGLVLVGVLVFLVAPTVMADTVTISFVANQFELPALTRVYANPDADITATATAKEGTEDAFLFGYFMGLGVIGQDGDPFQLDGRPDLEGAETLWLEFNKPVELQSATFSRVGTLPKRDHYRLLADDGAELARGLIPHGNWLDLGTGTVNFEDPMVGTRFGFTVTSRADDYVLRQIKVTAASGTKDGIAVVTIPLPAAAWAGMALLGAIVAVRQIRRMRRE